MVIETTKIVLTGPENWLQWLQAIKRKCRAGGYDLWTLHDPDGTGPDKLVPTPFPVLAENVTATAAAIQKEKWKLEYRDYERKVAVYDNITEAISTSIDVEKFDQVLADKASNRE